MPPRVEAAVAFTISPHAYQGRAIRESIVHFGHRHGVGDDDLSHFVTALGEALANAIEHAASPTPIEVAVRILDGQIIATVEDAGRGFAIGTDETLPDPASERGRGLPIMRRCTDSFSVQSFPGGGTKIAFGRNFRSTNRRSGAA